MGIGLVFKTSFDKANRTSASSARGIGLKAALPIFAEIRETVGLAVLTDVHEAAQCAPVAEAVDVLQIPAFLCRQTDPWSPPRDRARGERQEGGVPRPMGYGQRRGQAQSGDCNPNVLVTERGTSFGYNTLVADMRALPILARTSARR